MNARTTDMVQIERVGDSYVRLTLADEYGNPSSANRAEFGAPYLVLTEDEISDLIERLGAAKDGGYVRVSLSSGGTWTYVDPSRTLKVGDRVLVPFGYTNDRHVGTVVGLGRGSYNGHCKRVHAKLVAEELAA